MRRHVGSADRTARQRQPSRRPIFEETLEDRQFATTLARGLEILRCFTPQTPTLGNKDFVQLTGLPKATISRFTYTLTRLGYLRPVSGQATYQLGSAVLALGYPLLATMYVRQVARRQMNELASAVGGSVAMGVRERLNMIYVETSRSSAGNAPPFTDIGYTHPIAATSMGRAYLAACGSETRTAVLNEIRVKRPEDWKRYRGSIDTALTDYHRLGFCMSFDYFRPGICGVAVPLCREIDGEIIVFNCAVYAHDVRPRELERSVGPRLLGMCRAIESSLHH